MRESEEGALLEIVDDGIGFDPAGSGGGFGLAGMAERVALAGGTFEVDSAPGAGTTVRVRLPISPGQPTVASADARRAGEAP